MHRGLEWKSIAECIDPYNYVCRADRVCIKLEDINKEKYSTINVYLVPVSASDYIAFWVYFTMFLLHVNICDYIG